MRLKLFIVILFVAFSFAAKAQDATLVVISNNKGAPSTLKIDALKSVFKGEKQRWNDGTKVTIALMKTNTPVGSVTSRKIFNMSGDELRKFYFGLEFAGKGQYPNMFDTVEELQSFVARTPGAIGIISDSGVNPGIKEIMIEGKRTL